MLLNCELLMHDLPLLLQRLLLLLMMMMMMMMMILALVLMVMFYYLFSFRFVVNASVYCYANCIVCIQLILYCTKKESKTTTT